MDPRPKRLVVHLAIEGDDSVEADYRIEAQGFLMPQASDIRHGRRVASGGWATPGLGSAPTLARRPARCAERFVAQPVERSI